MIKQILLIALIIAVAYSTSCTSDSDCDDNFACKSNQCEDTCDEKTHSGCIEGYYCDSTFFCYECFEDEHCPENYACNNNYECNTSCIKDSNANECSGYSVCNDKNECVDCIDDYDCQGSTICKDQECVEPGSGSILNASFILIIGFIAYLL
ncbi:hypothetical protein PPERSA_04596 [Pseudocohnilembus persalinus]|uniref:Insulin-like growth factor binding protein, N-terminal n=1 Tax=Pseudocohnilembus persalinus TaxID=266149 RepID=A0A0V0QAM0_PSEPJ|nr:hypothetical protein PPERSA_04596 [Pseudocohnilembus persalinus]|eukprot:KRW99234.1 hypothetical protein PPERSA_04596 [Pseudocohnilembus persalinus]